MRESLYIHVGERPEQPIQWLIYNRLESEIIASGVLENAVALNTLTDKASEREVTLVLPSAQVQLHCVALPAKWNRKLEQALPYMIEEQLAVDVDAVFIARANAFSEGEQHFINIAIMSRQWFSHWLDALAGADIVVERAYSDALLLPEPEENRASAIAFNDDYFIVRHGAWQSAQLEPQWAPLFLQSAKVNALDLYSPLPEFLHNDIELLEHQDKYELPLALFAKSTSPINLRQGEFAYKKQRSGWIKIWRPALVACVVTGIFALAIKGAELYHYHSQAEQLKAQVVSTYQQAFPGTNVRPHLLRSQINGALERANPEQQADFLLLLQDVALVAKQTKGNFVPQTMRFDQRRKELRMRAIAKDFQSFGEFKNELELRGLEVEQGSLNNDGESVVGELRIRGAV